MLHLLSKYLYKALCLLCLVAINSLAVSAQHDYVVMHSGDILNAKRISFNHNKTRFKTRGGRVTVQSIDVKEYLRKGVKYVIVRNPFTHNLDDYVVISEGRATLLIDWGAELPIDECLLMFIDGETYFVGMGHFSDEIWLKLTACAAFKTKYGYYVEDNNKKILGLSKKRSRQWQKMLWFFNVNCL